MVRSWQRPCGPPLDWVLGRHRRSTRRQCPHCWCILVSRRLYQRLCWRAVMRGLFGSLACWTTPHLECWHRSQSALNWWCRPQPLWLWGRCHCCLGASEPRLSAPVVGECILSFVREHNSDSHIYHLDSVDVFLIIHLIFYWGIWCLVLV